MLSYVHLSVMCDTPSHAPLLIDSLNLSMSFYLSSSYVRARPMRLRMCICVRLSACIPYRTWTTLCSGEVVRRKPARLLSEGKTLSK